MTLAGPPPDHDPALDPEACYQALVARDARFDGSFFVGVSTTGIYCRPVCRARTPGRDRCSFFPHAALAEQAGFRACFRCRPERAPGQASVDAVSQLVASAVRRIEEGALNDGSVEDLARALGTSSRHLRRAMTTELGLGPVELAGSRRVALARELLRSTTLPVTDVAFASGFSSIRRFNDAYRASQKMTPSDVRRPGAPASDGILEGGLRIELDVRTPYDLDAAFAFLRARSVAGSEAFVDGAWVRAATIGGRTGLVAATASASRAGIVVEVSPSLAPSLMNVASRMRRVFDTDADPSVIDAHLARDPALARLVAARPGLRVMGAFEPFEWAVRAVIGQQISVAGARTIAARLVARLGTPVESALPGAPTHAWPAPSVLAAAPEADLIALGLSGARARTLRGLARAVADGRLVLDGRVDPATLMATLRALPGVGPWTAEYIAMRALHWPDAFPAGDLGLRKALGGITEAACERHAERWRPWRAYAAAHLWLGTAEATTRAPMATRPVKRKTPTKMARKSKKP